MGCVVTNKRSCLNDHTGLRQMLPKGPHLSLRCHGVFPAAEKFSLFFHTVSAVVA